MFIRKLLIFLFLPFVLHAIQLKDDGYFKAEVFEFLEFMEVPDLPDHLILPYVKERWLQANKERWDMDFHSEEKLQQALPYLQRIGCIDTIYASESEYDYALVLGATGPVMQKRLDFLYQEYLRGVHFTQIILLTGDRTLDPKRDGVYENLTNETELFNHLFVNHPLCAVAAHTIVDSKQQTLEDGTKRRPTTKNTLIDWLKLQPKPGKCLAVSTQPFVGYQEAIANTSLPMSFTIEGIGPALSSPYPLAIYLDNFAKWLLYEELSPTRVSRKAW